MYTKDIHLTLRFDRGIRWNVSLYTEKTEGSFTKLSAIVVVKR